MRRYFAKIQIRNDRENAVRPGHCFTSYRIVDLPDPKWPDAPGKVQQLIELSDDQMRALSPTKNFVYYSVDNGGLVGWETKKLMLWFHKTSGVLNFSTGMILYLCLTSDLYRLATKEEVQGYERNHSRTTLESDDEYNYTRAK